MPPPKLRTLPQTGLSSSCARRLASLSVYWGLARAYVFRYPVQEGQDEYKGREPAHQKPGHDIQSISSLSHTHSPFPSLYPGGYIYLHLLRFHFQACQPVAVQPFISKCALLPSSTLSSLAWSPPRPFPALTSLVPLDLPADMRYVQSLHML